MYLKVITERRCGNLVRLGLCGGTSLIAICGLLAAGSALAQTATVAKPSTEASDATAIIVTGIRQSLASAQTIKRKSDTIVDAITSEDIGALPDRSVTEALQRLPGVSINRFAGSNDPDHFSVEGSGVAIRGLTFVRSEFNGRDAFAAGTSGQALSFADVPAELLGSVEVYKNTTADMIEGGLAGTVNLNTRKPFDKKGFHLGVDVEANYGDFRKKWTPTGSLLISNTWDTDAGTFGILADVSYSKIDSRSDGLQITNFQTRDNSETYLAHTSTLVCRTPLPSNTFGNGGNFNCGMGPNTPPSAGTADPLGLAYAPIGGQYRSQNTSHEREGQALAFQFKTIDEKALFTVQYLRSHTTNDMTEHTLEAAADQSEYNTFPQGCTAGGACAPGFNNYTYGANNVFQSGYITLPAGPWRGPNAGSGNGVTAGGMQFDVADRQQHESATNQDFGFNAKLDPTDHWHIDLDFDYTKSSRDVLDVTLNGATFANAQIDLKGSTPSVILHKPTDLAYSWATPSATLASETDGQYFSDPNNQFWRSAMDHTESSTGREYAVRGDVTYKLDDGSFLKSIRAGLRATDRAQVVKYSVYNWGMLSETWSGTSPVSVGAFGTQNASFFSFPNFFRGKTSGPVGAYYYNGNLIQDYAGFTKFAQSVENYGSTHFGSSPTWSPLAARPGAVNGYLPSEVQPLKQRDFDAYLQANFGSDNPVFGGIRLSGNVGLRYVRTAVQSTGSLGVPSAVSLGIASLDANNNTVLTPYADRCATVVPPGAPAGTLPSNPGGVCNLSPAQYSALQTWSGNGATTYNAAKNSYNYFLPSLNLKFAATNNKIIRFAASKVMTRPENDYLRNFLTTTLVSGSNNLAAQTGNPYLKPATAWQFDLTAEWYFSRVGSLTADLFYKDVSNFFYQSVVNMPAVSNGVVENIAVRGPANYSGHGKIKGFELAYQQSLDFLPKPFNGLGVSANYTFIDSHGLPNTFLNGGDLAGTSTISHGNLPLEQLSKHNVNVEIFYENAKISVRAAYNWRSRFLLAAADVIYPYYSIFNEATGQMDASIFFNASKHVKFGLQGVNLLNEVTRTSQAYTGSPDQLAPRSYFMNDRRFSLIARASF